MRGLPPRAPPRGSPKIRQGIGSCRAGFSPEKPLSAPAGNCQDEHSRAGAGVCLCLVRHSRQLWARQPSPTRSTGRPSSPCTARLVIEPDAGARAALGERLHDRREWRRGARESGEPESHHRPPLGGGERQHLAGGWVAANITYYAKLRLRVGQGLPPFGNLLSPSTRISPAPGGAAVVALSSPLAGLAALVDLETGQGCLFCRSKGLVMRFSRPTPPVVRVEAISLATANFRPL